MSNTNTHTHTPSPIPPPSPFLSPFPSPSPFTFNPNPSSRSPLHLSQPNSNNNNNNTSPSTIIPSASAQSSVSSSLPTPLVSSSPSVTPHSQSNFPSTSPFPSPSPSPIPAPSSYSFPSSSSSTPISLHHHRRLSSHGSNVSSPSNSTPNSPKLRPNQIYIGNQSNTLNNNILDPQNLPAPPSPLPPHLLIPFTPPSSLSPLVDLSSFTSSLSSLHSSFLTSHSSLSFLHSRLLSTLKSVDSLHAKSSSLTILLHHENGKTETIKEDYRKSKEIEKGMMGDIERIKERVEGEKALLREYNAEIAFYNTNNSSTEDKLIQFYTQNIQQFHDIKDKLQEKLHSYRQLNINKYDELSSLLDYQETIRGEMNDFEMKIVEIKGKISAKMRQKQDFERQMKEIQILNGEKKHQIEIKKSLILKAEKENEEIEKQRERSLHIVNSHRSEYDNLTREAEEMKGELFKLREDHGHLVDKYKILFDETKSEKDNYNVIKSQLEGKIRHIEILKTKVSEMSSLHVAEEETEKNLKEEIKNTTQKLFDMEMKYNDILKSIEICKKEKVYLNSMVKESQSDQVRSAVEFRVLESNKVNIEREMEMLRRQIAQYEERIADIEREEKEKDEEYQSKMELMTKILLSQEVMDQQCVQYQSLLHAHHRKYSQQLSLLDDIRNDRNAYRSSLIDDHMEMSELQRRFLSLNNAVKQIKNDITDKDSYIVIEHFHSTHVEREIDTLSTQCHTLEGKLFSLKAEENAIHVEQKNFNLMISDGQQECHHEKNQLMNIKHEIHTLNKQFIELNEQIVSMVYHIKLSSSLYEQSVRGWKEGKRKCEMMKKEKDKMEENYLLSEYDENKYSTLISQIHQKIKYHNEILYKKSTLSYEREKKINLHRWRKMRDTDGETFGMMENIHQITKEMLQCNEEKESIKAMIKDKEKEMEEMTKKYHGIMEFGKKNKQITEGESSLQTIGSDDSDSPDPVSSSMIPSSSATSDLLTKRSKVNILHHQLRVMMEKWKKLTEEGDECDREMKMITYEWYGEKRREQMKKMGEDRDRKNMKGSGRGKGKGRGNSEEVKEGEDCDDDVRDPNHDSDDEYNDVDAMLLRSLPDVQKVKKHGAESWGPLGIISNVNMGSSSGGLSRSILSGLSTTHINNGTPKFGSLPPLPHSVSIVKPKSPLSVSSLSLSSSVNSSSPLSFAVIGGEEEEEVKPIPKD